MSTERLSAKDFLGLYLMDHPFPDDPAMIQAAEEYAAQEVEHQTKQLREERDKAVVLLNRVCTTLEDYSELLDSDPTCADINIFLNQLNQKNEG